MTKNLPKNTKKLTVTSVTTVKKQNGKNAVILKGKVNGAIGNTKTSCPYCSKRAIVREYAEAIIGVVGLAVMFVILNIIL